MGQMEEHTKGRKGSWRQDNFLVAISHSIMIISVRGFTGVSQTLPENKQNILPNRVYYVPGPTRHTNSTKIMSWNVRIV